MYAVDCLMFGILGCNFDLLKMVEIVSLFRKDQNKCSEASKTGTVFNLLAKDT